MNTIFDKIISRDIPATIVYESEDVMGFLDIQPQAPVHVLFVHKMPTKNILELLDKTPEQLPLLFQAAKEFVKQAGLEESGFRLVINTNRDAGQTVFHTHVHLLAGAPLGRFGQGLAST